jgi:putative transposase
MARKPRIEFDGAFYHVLVRGNQKQKIFLDKQDFRKYLQILGDYKSRYPLNLYGYVLMSNHVHLLIETGKTPLSKILQGINQRYTMYFNWKYETVGHLFQGRYKAILCDKEEYLLNLIKYIHHNPVRARLTEDADGYPWSSHRLFLKPKIKGIVDTHIALRLFSEDLGQAVRIYRGFMGGEGISRKELEKTVDQRILGNDKFVGKILDKAREGILPRKRQYEFGLEELAGGIQEVCGISREELKRKGRTSESLKARSMFCMIAKDYGYKGGEIGKFLGRDPGAVTKYLRGSEKSEEERKKVVSILENKAIFNIQV